MCKGVGDEIRAFTKCSSLRFEKIIKIGSRSRPVDFRVFLIRGRNSNTTSRTAEIVLVEACSIVWALDNVKRLVYLKPPQGAGYEFAILFEADFFG